MPGDLRNLLPEQRNVERPVGEQERAPTLVAELGAREEQPRGESEPGDELYAAGGDHRRRSARPASGPFDEQRLLFAGERALGAVRLHRNEPEERVEIEPGERPCVRPLPQVALSQPRLRYGRDRQRRRGSGHRDVGHIGIEQRDADRREDELERRSRELRAEVGQLANLVRRVRALGHVGRRAALKVSIGEPRDLPEEGRPQSGFEPPSHSERHRRDRQLEQQQDAGQAQDRHHRGETLAGAGRVRPGDPEGLERAAPRRRHRPPPGAVRREHAGDSAPSARINERRCLAG